MSRNVLNPLKIRDRLKNVIYSDDTLYIPSTFALEVVNFIKLVNDGVGESNKTPVLHMKMLDQIASGDTNIANMIFRGAAKSTLMEYLIFYIAVTGTFPGFEKVGIGFMIYVSDSIENGVKTMRKSLEDKWNKSAFLQQYLPQTRFIDNEYNFTNISGTKLTVKAYGAKAVSLDTKLLTDSGIVTMRDCKVGDLVFGPTGDLVPIVAKSEIFNKPMYKIILEDGRSIKVSEDHINSIVIKTNPNNRAKYVDVDMTTSELLNQKMFLIKKHNTNTSKSRLLFIRNIKAIKYSKKQLPIDPYTLGLLLGDGSMILKANNTLSCVLTAHNQDWKEYKNIIPYELGKQQIDNRNKNVETRTIRGLTQIIRKHKIYGHGDTKKIPIEYLYGSINQRKQLLAGLMDTDGTICKNGRMAFGSNSEELITGISSLIRSLGGKVKRRNDKNKKGIRIEIWVDFNPFILTRKKERFKKERYKDLVSIEKIIQINQEPSQCISIDSADHQYIVDDYVRTHNTGIRGARDGGVRPRIAFLDDLLSDDDARSPTIIASIEDTIYSAIDNALDPNFQLQVWNGTPFNQNDPLYKAIESGGWSANVFPVCEHFDENTTAEAFASAWPDRFGFDAIERKYKKAKKNKKLKSFYRELMLQISPEEEKLVDPDKFQPYDPALVENRMDMYNWYITTDFATSEKTAADYSAIGVWAYNNARHWMLHDGRMGKWTMGKNIDIIFDLVARYNIIAVTVETNGQQKGFVSWIKREQVARNIFFQVIEAKKIKDKFSMFQNMIPDFENDRMWISQRVLDSPMGQEIMEEIDFLTINGIQSAYDDGLDMISGLQFLHPWTPEFMQKEETEDVYGQESEMVFSIGSYIV